MKILGQVKDKKFATSQYNTALYHEYLKKPENDGNIIVIQDREEDSISQRRFFEGAVIPLLTYLNGWNHRQSKATDFWREEMKKEFNGKIEVLPNGKSVKVGLSTKGLLKETDKQNSGYVERVISYIEENYGVDRTKVLNTAHYKDFVDRVYSVSKYDDYIDYLVELNFLPRIETHNVFDE